MSNPVSPNSGSCFALVRFEPNPNVRYGLESAARLAGVSRRLLLIYSRAGIVKPLLRLPCGVLEFSEASVYVVRRIEHLRTFHGLKLVWIKAMLDLFAELELARAEVCAACDRK